MSTISVQKISPQREEPARILPAFLPGMAPDPVVREWMGLDVHSQKALAAFHLLANAVHPLRRLGEVPRSDESVEFYHDRPTYCFLKPVYDRLR